MGLISGSSCDGPYGKILNQMLPQLFIVPIKLLHHYHHDPFKSIACHRLGENGNVGSVSGQSCVGDFCKSLIQIVDMTYLILLF